MKWDRSKPAGGGLGEPAVAAATARARPDAAASRQATVWLTLVSVFWGGTFLAMKLGTERLRLLAGGDPKLAAAAFFLLLRFAEALVLMPILVPASVRRLTRAAWWEGSRLGLIYSLGFVLQVFGLSQADVQPSQSAFLTSLYVVATPIIGSLAQRRLPPLGVMLGVPLAVFGAAFIAGPPTGGLSLGAWMTIGCAITFSFQILVTDSASRRVDPMALTFTTLVFSTAFMALTLLAAPDGLRMLSPELLAATMTDPLMLATTLGCASLATVVALSVLNRWQRELHPSRAAIVYASEPVFAAVISVLAGRDTLSVWLLLAAAAILGANLLAAGLRPRG